MRIVSIACILTRESTDHSSQSITYCYWTKLSWPVLSMCNARYHFLIKQSVHCFSFICIMNVIFVFHAILSLLLFLVFLALLVTAPTNSIAMLQFISYNSCRFKNAKQLHMTLLLSLCDVCYTQEHWLSDDWRDLNSLSAMYLLTGESGLGCKNVLTGCRYGVVQYSGIEIWISLLRKCLLPVIVCQLYCYIIASLRFCVSILTCHSFFIICLLCIRSL